MTLQLKPEKNKMQAQYTVYTLPYDTLWAYLVFEHLELFSSRASSLEDYLMVYEWIFTA